MTNSEKNVINDKKRVKTITWAILIGVGSLWWFYPQIRAAFEPERVVIVSEEKAEETQLPAVAAEETQLPAVAAEETQLPAVAAEETQLPAVAAEETQLPAVAAEETQLPAVAAEETQLPAATVQGAQLPNVETGAVDVVHDSDTAATANATDKFEVQAMAEVVPQVKNVPSTDPVGQNEDEASKQTDSADMADNTMVSADLKLQKSSVGLPKFDLVRVEENGSAVIAGLADGMGYVILSVDGVELPDARANLNGGGEFVIFALLPSTQAPQALRLHLYTEEEGAVVISTEVVFVAAVRETKSLGFVESVDTDKAADVATQPTVILADKSGVRILQDGSINSPIITVSIDTISYNLQGEVSIGGRATGRGFVRVYLDNNVITTSRISDNGYWAVDLLNVDAGVYTLRVDELNLVGKVLSRAQTPFKREAQADLVALMAVTNGITPESMETKDEVETEQKPDFTQTTVAVQVEIDDLVASKNGIDLEAKASGTKRKITEVPLGEAEISFRTPSLAFRIKTVQPGSTLWAIAKESYGAGIEYFKVFEANKERIRDPDLIYPGQVFEIPD